MMQRSAFHLSPRMRQRLGQAAAMLGIALFLCVAPASFSGGTAIPICTLTGIKTAYLTADGQIVQNAVVAPCPYCAAAGFAALLAAALLAWPAPSRRFAAA